MKYINNLKFTVFMLFLLSLSIACDSGGDSKSVDPDTPNNASCNPVNDIVGNPVAIETGTGEIRGTVVSSSGTPLNGVHVRAVNIDNPDIQLGIFSGIDRNLILVDGAFSIQNVPPGSYRVLIEKLDARNRTFDINSTGYGEFVNIESTSLSFPDEYYNGTDESATDVTTDFDVLVVSNGMTVGGVDFITND